jgi:hypothetical protein
MRPRKARQRRTVPRSIRVRIELSAFLHEQAAVHPDMAADDAESASSAVCFTRRFVRYIPAKTLAVTCVAKFGNALV